MLLHTSVAQMSYEVNKWVIHEKLCVSAVTKPIISSGKLISCQWELTHDAPVNFSHSNRLNYTAVKSKVRFGEFRNHQ